MKVTHNFPLFLLVSILLAACATLEAGIETSTTGPPATTVSSPDAEVACPPVTLSQPLDPDETKLYVGQYVEGHAMPLGLQNQFGELVEIDGVEYAWNVYMQNDGSFLFFWEKLYCRDHSGQPYWEILDAVSAPALVGEQVLLNNCTHDGQPVAQVAAIVNQDASIVQAWQVDTDLHTITEIPTDGLSCDINDGRS
jgi:hypothetical protein